jgi:hypothetical protein
MLTHAHATVGAHYDGQILNAKLGYYRSKTNDSAKQYVNMPKYIVKRQTNILDEWLMTQQK